MKAYANGLLYSVSIISCSDCDVTIAYYGLFLMYILCQFEIAVVQGIGVKETNVFHHNWLV